MINGDLDKITRRITRCDESAQRILDGGENYDGADGAREVSELCGIAFGLIADLRQLLNN